MNITKEVVFQDRPWTFVHLEVEYRGMVELETFGFSKVCHPDEWDEESGVFMATQKALYKLAKELFQEELERIWDG